jgi:hypothetical protein
MKRLAALGMLFASLGCAADPPEDTGEGAEAVSSGALRITGEWALVSWKGHFTTRRGSIVDDQPLDRTFDARERSILAVFDIDGDGNGTVQGSKHCTPEPTDRGGMPTKTGTKGSIVEGVWSLASAIWDLVQTTTCDPSVPVVSSTRVWQRRGFLGQPSSRLDANIGVYGEPASVSSADAECRALRGARWIAFDTGVVACIGFADKQARSLKMIVQRPGEIRVQRLVLRRPADP